MGIYLPNMEMPKRGHTITITIVGSGQAYVEYFDCRPRVKETIEYTAVPVPAHGRLGDLDEIVRYKERLVVDADKINPAIRYVVDTKYIEGTPTVIPASGGNEDE